MLNELKQIKNFVKQNPNQEGQDYIEQDKRIGLFNGITGLSFNSIISTEPVYISYAKFFKNPAIKKEISKEEGKAENIQENKVEKEKKESETLNNKLNSKKVLLFPDTRQAKKNIPRSLIDKLENELVAKGYTLEIAYFKEVPDIATTNNENSASNNKVVYANFKTLIQLIIDAELILGADSLPIHLAYLLKKSHYILYPNGYPQLFMTPYAQINNRFGTFDHYNFSFL